MSNPRPTDAGYAPRLLRRERAAGYLGVSPSKFDQLVAIGVLPPPKRLATISAWDRADLDALVDNLPYEGAPVPSSVASDDWDAVDAS